MAGNKFSGRRPTPTHLKVLRGNPGKRPLNRLEPTPRPIAPKPPRSGISAEARAFWKQHGPKQEELGLLRETDGPLWQALCEAWATWRYCLKRWWKTRDWRDQVRQEKALAQFAALGKEFGMSPSARTRFSIPETQEEDELLKLMRDAEET